MPRHNLILGLSVAQLSQLLQLRLGQSCDNKTVTQLRVTVGDQKKLRTGQMAPSYEKPWLEPIGAELSVNKTDLGR
jgi:hypothetical protein